MIYGYARCSTNDSKQDIRRQIRELKAAGAEEVVFEYEHGDARIKKELQMLLDTARVGDSIITLEVSRLSRSTQQLCEIVEVIKRKHLRLVIVGSITVDCRSGEIDPMSQAFIQMERGLCRTGTVHRQGKGEKRHGECQSQGAQNRQTAQLQGGHPRHISQALSGLQDGKDECKRAGAGVRNKQTNGV